MLDLASSVFRSLKLFTVLQRELCHWRDAIIIRTVSAWGGDFKSTRIRYFLTFIFFSTCAWMHTHIVMGCVCLESSSSVHLNRNGRKAAFLCFLKLLEGLKIQQKSKKWVVKILFRSEFTAIRLHFITEWEQFDRLDFFILVPGLQTRATSP